MWRLVVTLMKIYNEVHQDKEGKEKTLRRKSTPESGLGLNPMFKEINRQRNGTKGMVTSGHDTTQLSFQLVERNFVEIIKTE